MKLILPLLLFSFNCFSQTKADTELWIKNNLEAYRDKGKFVFTDIFFEGGNMVVHQPIGNVLFYSSIPLKEIKQIIIQEYHVEEREGFTIKFLCKTATNCIEEGKIINNKKEPSFGSAQELSKLFLDISFKGDNLPTRMKKALNHIVDLNGGKLIDDTF